MKGLGEAREQRQQEVARSLVVPLRNAGMSFRELGEKMGVSQVRARQIYLAALDKAEVPVDAPPEWRALRPHLSTRTFNALRRHGFTPELLAHAHETDLLAIPNFGRGSLREVAAALANENALAPR